jgi:hypothetical protein
MDQAMTCGFWFEGCCCEGEGVNLGGEEKKVQKHKKFGSLVPLCGQASGADNLATARSPIWAGGGEVVG